MEDPSKLTKPTEDEWGTTTREGYEDRGAFRPRKAAGPQRKGSRFLRVAGGLLVVGGLAWITFISTSPDGFRSILKPDLRMRPIVMLGAGLLVLLLEKLLK